MDCSKSIFSTTRFSCGVPVSCSSPLYVHPSFSSSGTIELIYQFPVVHIPVINNKVFLVNGLGWEWGIVFGMILVYLVSTEAWKWGKRVYFRRKAAKQPGNSHPTDKTLRMEPTVAPRV
jgi:hypothetical protein